MKDFKSRLAEAMQSKVVSRYKLAKDCGLSASTVTNWLTGSTMPDKTKIELVSNYLDTTPEWLLEGKGKRFKEIKEIFTFSKDDCDEWDVAMASEVSGDDDIDLISEISKLPKEKVQEILKNIQYKKEIEKEIFEQNIGLQFRPRVPLTAAAGSLSGDSIGVKLEQCEQMPLIHQIPSYDFTMFIKGDSMSPRFESGDEIACRHIDQSRFIQWGKVHVLDTTQGFVIKRVYEDGNKIRCVSYNPEYADFSIPKEDILSMSLVVGVVSIMEM